MHLLHIAFLGLAGEFIAGSQLAPALVDFTVGAVKIAVQIAPLFVRHPAIGAPVIRSPLGTLKFALRLTLKLALRLTLVSARPLLHLHVHPAAAKPVPLSRRGRLRRQHR